MEDSPAVEETEDLVTKIKAFIELDRHVEIHTIELLGDGVDLQAPVQLNKGLDLGHEVLSSQFSSTTGESSTTCPGRPPDELPDVSS